MALDPSRVVRQLRELQELTGDENGAQRVAWTETWNTARAWLDGLLDGLPLERERDAAGNDWWTLRGELRARRPDRRPHRLRRRTAAGSTAASTSSPGQRCCGGSPRRARPPVTVRLVNWADEEGCTLRALAPRLLGRGRVDARPGGAAPPHRPRRRLAPRRARSLRRRPRPRARRARAARLGCGVPRAPHRAGPRPRDHGDPPRRRARDVRRRALAHHLDGAGRPRRLDTDGSSAATRSPAPPSSRSRSATSRRGSATVPSARRAASSAGRGSSPRSSRRRSSCSTSVTSTRRASPRCCARRRRRASASPPRRTSR